MENKQSDKESDKVMLKVLVNAQSYDNILRILEMIRYYWFCRDNLFSMDLLGESLDLLADGRNPFLSIKGKMEAEIKKKGNNYGLSSDVFYLHLPNDDSRSKLLEVPQRVITVTRIDPKTVIQCGVCQQYDWKIFMDTQQQKVILMCKECNEIKEFPLHSINKENNKDEVVKNEK